MSNRCTIEKAAATFAKPENREGFLDLMDGFGAHVHASPFEAAQMAQQLGFRVTAPIVRRHRRRHSGTGEACWCEKRGTTA